ncbi:MAG TPA: glycosyltransferase family 1 protein [Candidatus Sulfotelmatobacter sp.]|nr:glycosyltransferase family 1 protein [Candidatus Sulfotelmatobacter sp.]
MRIGIDARPLYQAQRTGIANYIYELLKELPRIAPEHEYILYAHKEIKGVPTDSCIQTKVDSRFGLFPGSFWLLSRGSHLIRRDTLDVFWSTVTMLPLWVPKRVFRVVTVYDVVWRRFPETMRTANFWLHRMRAETAIRNCDRMIAISRSTGDDLVNFFGVACDRIRLVYPAISEVYKPQDPLLAASYICRKYGVPPRYMAAVGTVEPRKNLTLLVRAMQILKRTGRFDCPLLIAGANGWKNSPLYQEVQKSGLTQDEIRFLGYVPDDDLPLFYAGAKVFLFPSLYEGFGLPPLEAMACGTPVIASNAPPMPETLGDAAILEPPSSAERFVEAIAKVLRDDELSDTMRRNGKLRAQNFRRDTSARALLNALSPA